MIELSVYNEDGQQTDSLKVDESVFGGSVKYPLLKQAIVMYHANRRVGTAATKSRGMVTGSSKKLFRQKGTGSARVGTKRTGKRVGGGVTFAKKYRDFSRRMPKKQRRLARDSAILAKLISDNVVLVEKMNFDEPKTAKFAKLLADLKIERSCLVASESADVSLYKSVRNIPDVAIMPVGQLNAGAICNHQKMLFTKSAFQSLLDREKVKQN